MNPGLIPASHSACLTHLRNVDSTAHLARDRRDCRPLRARPDERVPHAQHCLKLAGSADGTCKGVGGSIRHETSLCTRTSRTSVLTPQAPTPAFAPASPGSRGPRAPPGGPPSPRRAPLHSLRHHATALSGRRVTSQRHSGQALLTEDATAARPNA